MMETIKQQQPSNTIYQTHKVTLFVFMQCVCHKDYSGLNANGKATQEELNEAFHMLYEEYCKLTNNTTYDYQFVLLKKLLLLDAKQVLAKAATLINSEELLKQAGYTKNNLTALYKRDSFTINQTIDEIEKMRLAAKNKQITVADFTRWRIRISKFMGYYILAEHVLLSDFIEMDKEYINSLKKA